MVFSVPNSYPSTLMTYSPNCPQPGERVILSSAPAELLAGLPQEDQSAISDVVGKPVLLVGYDDHGRAELQFTGSNGTVHFIYVQPTLVRAIGSEMDRE